MPGEDFAWYLQDKPGCFAFIGIQNPEIEATYDHHNNRFNMDDTVSVSYTHLVLVVLMNQQNGII